MKFFMDINRIDHNCFIKKETTKDGKKDYIVYFSFKHKNVDNTNSL